MPENLQRFYLTSYTSAGGPGIGAGHLSSGRPILDAWTSGVTDPSWVDVSADHRTLYAISEIALGGLVNALHIGDGGDLTVINRQHTGTKPAHVVVHPGGQFLITSMYNGGSIALHRIGADGSVGPICDAHLLAASDASEHSGPAARTSPQADHDAGHAHQVVLDPTAEYLLAVDLGFDSVVTYRLDADAGRLTEFARTRFSAGSGPRHLIFHPRGRHAYLVNELDSTVTICDWRNGALTANRTTVTRPAAPGPNYPGEIVLAADGRFAYVSNRGDNSIAIFKIKDGGAGLELLGVPSCGGDWPRHLAIDRTGSWLYAANERSGDLTWFAIDPVSGLIGEVAGQLPVAGAAQLRLLD